LDDENVHNKLETFQSGHSYSPHTRSK
jgi:hypothetical protein